MIKMDASNDDVAAEMAEKIAVNDMINQAKDDMKYDDLVWEAICEYEKVDPVHYPPLQEFIWQYVAVNM